MEEESSIDKGMANPPSQPQPEPKIDIPPQYQGLPREVVAELWQPGESATGDQSEKDMRARVLAYLEQQELRHQIENADSVGKITAENSDNQAITNIRQEISGKPDKSKEANETQELLPNLLLAKKQILEILDRPNPDKGLIARAIYDALTTRSSYVAKLESYGPGLNGAERLSKFNQENNQRSQEYAAERQEVVEQLARMGMNCTKEAWLHIDTNPGLKSEGINKKLYATLPLESDFIPSLPSLAQKLQAISQQSGSSIKLKFPASYAIFAMRNDSLVIHFKDESLEPEITRALDEWKNENGITEEPREMGRVKVAADSKETSFSDLVARNIADWVIDQHGKYENDLLAELAIKYAVEQSQKPPTVQQNQ